ncbi:MAG TPA: hypothetical protein VFQ85_01275 [Mycobacteriales bacterium]|nr:hypothetical protein [Mycobacteriales bacterium]
MDRLIRLTDRLLVVVPGPLRRVLRRPLEPGRSPVADAVATVVRVTLLLSVAGFALLAVTHLVDLLALDDRIHAFNADSDDSAWGWASVAVEAGAALLLGLLAATSARRRALTACALVVAFLSFDDFLAIHERVSRLGEHLPVEHAERLVWPVVWLPVLAVAFVLLWRIAEGGGDAARALVRGGLLALVVAVFLEAASPVLFAAGEEHGSAGYETEVAVEEGLELAGWIWIAGGLAVTLLLRLGAPEQSGVLSGRGGR